METVPAEPPAREPAPAEVAALLVIVTAVSAVARAVPGFTLLPPWWSAVGAGLAAAVLGLPLLVYALEHGQTGTGASLVFGAFSGAGSLLVLMLSGMLRLSLFGDWAGVAGVFRLGLALPMVGLVRWPDVARLEAQAMVVGVASALLFQLTVLRPIASTAVRWSASALILSLVALSVWLIG